MSPNNLPDYRHFLKWSIFIEAFQIFERSGCEFNLTFEKENMSAWICAGELSKVSKGDIERLKELGWNPYSDSYTQRNGFVWNLYDYYWSNIIWNEKDKKARDKKIQNEQAD